MYFIGSHSNVSFTRAARFAFRFFFQTQEPIQKINCISQKKTVTTMKRNARIMGFPIPEIPSIHRKEREEYSIESIHNS
jgi:hypothetical protein